MIEGLKNRLGEPIPERCPIQEAIIFLTIGSLPLSRNAYKVLGPQDIGDSFGVIDAILLPTNEGRIQEIKTHQFDTPLKMLILALNNGQVRAWGNLYKEDYDPEFEAYVEEREILGLNIEPDEYPYGDPRLIKANTVIPAIEWNLERLNLNIGSLILPPDGMVRSYYTDIDISTDDLVTQFNEHINSLLNGTETKDLEINNSTRPRRGRPAAVKKELWQEELIIYLMSEIGLNKLKQDALSAELIEALWKHHKEKISLETVRKNWLRPLWKIVRDRKGDN